MKTLNYIFCTLVFTIGTLSFVSCGDKNGDDDIDGGNIKTGWTESGDTLTFSATSGAGSYQTSSVWTFKFNGDSCTQARCVVTFPSAAIAQTAYAALDSEDKQNTTISGSSITMNYDAEYAGMSKAELKAAIEAGAGGGWF